MNEESQQNKTSSLKNYREMLNCECMSVQKSVQFLFIPDVKLGDENNVTYVSVMLSNWRGLVKRAVASFRKMPSGGLFDTPSFATEDMGRLIDVLQEHLKRSGGDTGDIKNDGFDVRDGYYVMRFDQTVLNLSGTTYPELSLSVYFDDNCNFLRRYWRRTKYICGYVSQYGLTAEFELNASEVRMLMYLAQEHQKHG